MEQQLAAGLSERQIAELVHDDEVGADQAVGNAALAAELDLRLELVDEVDDVEEARLPAGADAAPRDADGDVAFASARAADQHDVPLRVEEGSGRELSDQLAVDR